MALRAERGFLGAHALLGGEFLVVDVTKIPLGVEADAGGERAFVGIDDAALDGLEVIFVLAEGEAGGDPREQAFASDIGVGAGLGEFFPGDADGEIVGAGEAESRGEVDGLRRGDGEEGRGYEGDSGEGERTREGHEGRDQGRFEPLIFANFSERRPSPYRLRPRLGGIG